MSSIFCSIYLACTFENPSRWTPCLLWPLTVGQVDLAKQLVLDIFQYRYILQRCSTLRRTAVAVIRRAVAVVSLVLSSCALIPLICLHCSLHPFVAAMCCSLLSMLLKLQHVDVAPQSHFNLVLGGLRYLPPANSHLSA